MREYLSLLEGLNVGIAMYDIEEFYFLARTALVKDERHLDKFDRVFTEIFQGVEAVGGGIEGVEEQPIPEAWLQKLAEKHLSEEEKSLVESLGGWDKLMETLKKRLAEQEKRHQGGRK